MESERELLCPRCRTPLMPVEVEGAPAVRVPALQCGECAGQWFRGEDLQRIEDVVEVKLVEFRHVPDAETQLAPLDCPACPLAGTMRKIQHARDRHVIIDACADCQGVWLDGGELEAIQEESLFPTLGRILRWLKS